MGIEDLLQNVLDDNYAAADKEFESLVGEKIGVELENEKMAVAQGMFSDEEFPEPNEAIGDDELEVDLDDEELDQLDLEDIDLDDIDLDDE